MRISCRPALYRRQYLLSEKFERAIRFGRVHPGQLAHRDELRDGSVVEDLFDAPSHEIDRPQKPGAFKPFRVGANEGLARIRAISCGEPFRVELGLIDHRRARLEPRLHLAISNVNDTARNDAIARRVLAHLLEGVEVEHDFALAADRREAEVEFRRALDGLGRRRPPKDLRMGLAYRPWQHAHTAKMEILAIEVEALTGPCAAQNLECFERAAEPLAAWNTEALKLLRTVAQSESEPQASV